MLHFIHKQLGFRVLMVMSECTYIQTICFHLTKNLCMKFLDLNEVYISGRVARTISRTRASKERFFLLSVLISSIGNLVELHLEI